jgi:puromycin-sensitive aminopeptidase
MPEQSHEPYRLPDYATPQRYDLRLSPDLGAARFSGEETVSLTIHRPTDEIVLNAVDLEISTVSIIDAGGQAHEGQVVLDVANEQARFRFPRTLAPGTWQLRAAFRGSLNAKLAGFYRSTYTADSGEERVLATTQFEATDARRAFPCWDEPAFKAIFAVTLNVDQHLTAIANGPMLRETPAGPGKKDVQFAETMPMSTYLVAFVVGEFVGGEEVTAAGVPLRVWSVPGKEQLTAFAREAGAFALAFFAGYYGIPYPGEKLDLIAIPDFAFGAMENLGAVTFRETALLLDERTATHAELQGVAEVIAHELAHMWFGDLVTMRWWNGIWLNEAFATFMQMLAVDAWKPEWQTWLSFSTARSAALLIDGLHSTRPIEFPVGRPEEAQAMFDVLTYEKGGAVLRMLQQYLGPEVFRQGISQYLKQHALGNTETSDLWDALEAVSGQPVRRTMDSWIFQPGYPLVSVEATDDAGALMLSQTRFLYLGGDSSPSLWQIPVMLKTATRDGEQELKTLVEEQQVRVELPSTLDWTVANAGGHGFYRVRYAPALLRRLMPHIHERLSPVERFNLVNDTWAAALAGYIPLAEFLDLTALFREETDESVWTSLAGAFGSLRRTMGPEQQSAIALLVRDRLSPAQRRLGWSPQPDEDARTRQLRGLILSALGTVGNDPAIQAEAQRQYGHYRQDATSVDPNIVPAIVVILAATGDGARYDEFWQSYREARNPQDEERYLFALSGFRDPALLAQTLDRTLGSEIRSQDAPYLIRSVFANREGSELAWAFLKQHWDELLARFPENAIPRMCEGVTALTTPELETDVKQWFAMHEVKQGGKQIDQHLERLHMGVLFRRREAANLSAYASPDSLGGRA